MTICNWYTLSLDCIFNKDKDHVYFVHHCTPWHAGITQNINFLITWKRVAITNLEEQGQKEAMFSKYLRLNMDWFVPKCIRKEKYIKVQESTY